MTFDEAISEVDKRFGHLPSNDVAKQVFPKELPQRSERRVRIKGHGELPMLAMVFHAPTYQLKSFGEGQLPNANDEPKVQKPSSLTHDYLIPYALHLFSVILGHGRTSRLYRKIVETQKAVSVWANNSIYKEAALFSVFATLTSQASLSEVENIIWEELQALICEPPSHDELTKALRQEEASFLRALVGPTERAYHIGAYEVLGNWKMLNDYLPNLRLITPEILMLSGKQVFTETNRTIGWFEPSHSLVG